jgi:hypothetical protein
MRGFILSASDSADMWLNMRGFILSASDSTDTFYFKVYGST